MTSDTTNRRVRHMTGVPSRPATHRNSGPDEKQALLTFHQELTETCVDLMSRYSFAICGVQEPDAEVRPLVKNDSHVSVARAGSGSRRGSLVSAGVSECGCWCQVKIIVT